MNEIKCAIKIMKKNGYIEIRKIGNKFYYYWIIESKVGTEIINKFKKYFQENKNFIYIENSNITIKFTTESEIKKGLEEIFKNEKTTRHRGPIHFKVHKYLNTERCHKKIGYNISSNLYGHNDLGHLSEIIHIDKEEEKNKAEMKREKEANELLDKLLL